MRRALILTLLTLAAAAPASAAGPALTLGPTNASFLAVDRSLWVQVSWTPPSRSTDVTVVVQQGSSTLKTLQSKHWMIGKKTFTLSLPRTVPDGAVLTLKVRAKSSAGSASRTVSVPLSARRDRVESRACSPGDICSRTCSRSSC